jgi:hypothetical protein
MGGMAVPARLCLVAALASLGCASAFETRVADVDLRAPRVAALPAHVVISEYDVTGAFTPNAEWTQSATLFTNVAVERWVKARGGRMIQRNDLQGTAVAQEEVGRWLDETLESISNAMARGSENQSVASWRLRRPLSDWRAALGADYVLGFRAWDAHETAGVRAANAVFKTGGPGHPRNVGIACLLSLADGRVVACSRAAAVNVKRKYLFINDSDLESPEAADSAVAYILDGLLAPNDGVRR